MFKIENVQSQVSKQKNTNALLDGAYPVVRLLPITESEGETTKIRRGILFNTKAMEALDLNTNDGVIAVNNYNGHEGLCIANAKEMIEFKINGRKVFTAKFTKSTGKAFSEYLYDLIKAAILKDNPKADVNNPMEMTMHIGNVLDEDGHVYSLHTHKQVMTSIASTTPVMETVDEELEVEMEEMMLAEQEMASEGLCDEQESPK